MILSGFKSSVRIFLLVYLSTVLCIANSIHENDPEKSVYLINNSKFCEALFSAGDIVLFSDPHHLLEKMNLRAIENEAGEVHMFDAKNMKTVSDTTVAFRFIEFVTKNIVSTYKANEEAYVKEYLFLKKFMELNPSYQFFLPDLTQNGSIDYQDLENDIRDVVAPFFENLLAKQKTEMFKTEQILEEQAPNSVPWLEMDESIDPRLKFWARRVQKILAQQWNPPRGLDILGSAQVTVKFTVKRSGDIESIGIETSSGNESLDQAGIKTIEKIGKMPPIPPNYREKDELITTIIFAYEGD